jgi:hypothetical protein
MRMLMRMLMMILTMCTSYVLNVNLHKCIQAKLVPNLKTSIWISKDGAHDQKLVLSGWAICSWMSSSRWWENLDGVTFGHHTYGGGWCDDVTTSFFSRKNYDFRTSHKKICAFLIFCVLEGLRENAILLIW